MNNYRVDRSNSRTVPEGMDSILYMGGNGQKAREVFERANPGFAINGRPSATHGVILSVWDAGSGSYTVKATKGLYIIPQPTHEET